MGAQWMDSFDHYGTGADLTAFWRDSNAPGSMSFVSGYLGGKAWRLGPNTGTQQTASKRIHPTTSVATVVLGFWFSASSYAHSNDRTLFYIEDDAGNFVCSLHHAATDPASLQVCRGAGGTTVLATGGTVTGGVWHHIQAKITPNNTTGLFKVLLDGVQVINFTGDTTSGNENATALRFYGTNTSNGVTKDVDHLYVFDTSGSINNDLLSPDGRCTIATLYPSGAGASTQWTPNTGTNYQAVDEIGEDGDTTYVATATASNKDLYAFDNIGASDVPLAVTLTAVVKKDDATARTIAPTMRSGATDLDGTTVTLTTTYDYIELTRDTDPNTSAAWTKSAVDALQAGVKAVS